MGVRMLGGLLHWVRAALTAAVGLAGLGGTSPAPQERRRSRATVELDRQHRADPATVAGKTPVRYLEDLDEQQAAAETITFGLDGVSYEIDLSPEHAATLREDLARWIGHARRTSSRATARSRGREPSVRTQLRR